MKPTDELRERLALRAPVIRAAAERIGLVELGACGACNGAPCERHAAFFRAPGAPPDPEPSKSQRGYADAFAAGIRDEIGPYVLPVSVANAAAAIGRAAAQHARRADGSLIVDAELLLWIRTTARAFARARTNYTRGGLTPWGFAQWLNERGAAAPKPAKKASWR